MMKTDVCILIAEDDSLTRMMISGILRQHYSRVYDCENGRTCLELYNKHRPDVVITDLMMPVMNGYELIGEITKIDPKQKIIVLSAMADSADKLPGYRVVDKPIVMNKLIQLINTQL